MIQFNPAINNINAIAPSTQQPLKTGDSKGNFSDAIKAAESCMEKVNQQQTNVDTSVQDLLSGKTNDITSVVAEAAKADMSFKLLVGVRNKLIEAYKQTMNMQI